MLLLPVFGYSQRSPPEDDDDDAKDNGPPEVITDTMKNCKKPETDSFATKWGLVIKSDGILISTVLL